MRKPTFCLCKNKGANHFCRNCEAYHRLCFRYMDSTIPLLSNFKFPVSRHLLCLYSLVCVGPVQKPHCWFSHDAAHVMAQDLPDVQVFNTSDSPIISSTRKSVGVSLSLDPPQPAGPGLAPTPPTGILSTMVRGLGTVGKLFSSLGLFLGVDLCDLLLPKIKV